MTAYNPVRALERGLAVLRMVNARDGLRTSDIAQLTGIARPTVHRLLETLAAQGYVVQSPSGGEWHPTLECNLLSSGFLDKAWVGQIAMPEMVRLGREVLWPLDLVTHHGDAMQIRESTHKTSPFSFDVGMIGTLLPILHTAGGHVHLAFCPDDEREVILDLLRRSDKPEHALARDPRMVQSILDRTRAHGFGIRTEGYKAHTQSISFPIWQGDRLLAALTIICLKSAISFDEMVRRFVDPMTQTCQTISDAMLEHAPEPPETFTP